MVPASHLGESGASPVQHPETTLALLTRRFTSPLNVLSGVVARGSHASGQGKGYRLSITSLRRESRTYSQDKTILSPSKQRVFRCSDALHFDRVIFFEPRGYHKRYVNREMCVSNVTLLHSKRYCHFQLFM